MRNARRIGIAPGVADVGVDRIAVALELPVGGHRDLVPAGDVEVRADRSRVGRAAGLGDQWNFHGPLSDWNQGEAVRSPRSAVAASGNGIKVACGASLLRPIIVGVFPVVGLVSSAARAPQAAKTAQQISTDESEWSVCWANSLIGLRSLAR